MNFNFLIFVLVVPPKYVKKLIILYMLVITYTQVTAQDIASEKGTN